MSIHTANEITGKDVITEDGHDLGEVKDWVFDVSAWKVRGFVIKLNRDILEKLHMKKPLMGTQEIEIAAEYISGIANRVVLNKNLADFANLTGTVAEED